MKKVKIYRTRIYRRHPYRGYRYSHTEYSVISDDNTSIVVTSYQLSNKNLKRGFNGVIQFIGSEYIIECKVLLKDTYLNF